MRMRKPSAAAPGGVKLSTDLAPYRIVINELIGDATPSPPLEFDLAAPAR